MKYSYNKLVKLSEDLNLGHSPLCIIDFWKNDGQNMDKVFDEMSVKTLVRIKDLYVADMEFHASLGQHAAFVEGAEMFEMIAKYLSKRV